MCITYVGDLIFWARDEDNIHDLIMELQDLGVDLEQEDSDGFLGVTLEYDESTDLMEMKQTGLTDCIIEALGLDDGMVKGKYTPSEAKPLVKDEEGEEAYGTFSYSSVIGMLL